MYTTLDLLKWIKRVDITQNLCWPLQFHIPNVWEKIKVRLFTSANNMVLAAWYA